MDAAAKTAQAEARSKNRTAATRVAPKPGPEKAAETSKPLPQTPELPKTASLFDAPAPATPAPDQDEEEEILAEAAEPAQIDEQDEELDDAA